jgi:hypothetical protein
MARQHLPVERAAQALADLLGVECSTGFLDNIYNEAKDGLEDFYNEVRRQLIGSDVVHFDETPMRVGVVRHWVHVCSNNLLTLLHSDSTRGKAAVKRAGVLENFRGVCVSDRLSMYFGYKDSKHQVCNAHLLRDLASVGEITGQAEWATQMAELLTKTNEQAHSARKLGKSRLSFIQLAQLSLNYDLIVKQGLAQNQPLLARKRNNLEKESYNLVQAFLKLKDEITLFAYDLSIPFTNNQAENDLRMVKLQQKISGSMRSASGLGRFAKVRSYISTCSKQNVNVIDALCDLFLGKPWMPPVPARI